jgi:hypothetical protein
MALNDSLMRNNQLEGTWQEAVMVCFEVLLQHLHGGMRNIMKNYQGSWFPG